MLENKEQEISELKAKIEVYEQWRTYNSTEHEGLNTYLERDLDLKKLFLVLWNARLKIIVISLIFSVVSVIYALSIPNIYTSTIKLIPSQQNDTGGLSSLASQYGGLASLAGINLGGGSANNSIQHVVELMSSWPYLEEFVNKYNLKSTIMASEGWRAADNRIIYNTEIYEPINKKWLAQEGVTLEPSSFETFQKVKKDLLSVSIDEELGILTISVSHYSPEVAYKLTNLLTKDVNEYFRAKDQKEAKASIEFIERKLRTTSNTGMLEVFYSMIESHTQTLMLTEISEEYLVKTLIPAKVADVSNKTKPNRALICVLGTLLGVTVSLILVFIVHFTKTIQ